MVRAGASEGLGTAGAGQDGGGQAGEADGAGQNGQCHPAQGRAGLGKGKVSVCACKSVRLGGVCQASVL